MEKNFTALDIQMLNGLHDAKDLSRKSFDINTIFLTLIVVTLAVLAILLFILIQKKMQELAYVGFIA